MTSIRPLPIFTNDGKPLARPEGLTVHISTLADKSTALYKAHQVLGRHSVHALFAVNKATQLNVTEGMAIFRLLDADGDGNMTIDNVIYGLANNKEVVQLIERYSDTPLGLLQSSWEVGRLLDKIDTNRDKTVSKEEWKDFLALIIMCDIDYLVAKGMNMGQCYWGRGLGDTNIVADGGDNEEDSDDEEKVSAATATGTTVGTGIDGIGRTTYLWCIDGRWLERCHIIDRGWWEDFCYYQQNNHALLFLFGKHDPRHPLKRHSIVNIEFVTQAFGLFLLAHVILRYCDFSDPRAPRGCGYPPFYVTLCLVALPMVLMRNLLHFLYRCPCVLSRHEMTTARQCGFRIVRWSGHALGTLFFFTGVIMLSVGLNIVQHAGATCFNTWLLSVIQSYIVCVILDLIFKFNPFRWAFKLRKLVGERIFRVFVTVSLAQWQSERDLAMNTERNYMQSLMRDEYGSAVDDMLPDHHDVDQVSDGNGDNNGELCECDHSKVDANNVSDGNGVSSRRKNDSSSVSREGSDSEGMVVVNPGVYYSRTSSATADDDIESRGAVLQQQVLPSIDRFSVSNSNSNNNIIKNNKENEHRGSSPVQTLLRV